MAGAQAPATSQMNGFLFFILSSHRLFITIIVRCDVILIYLAVAITKCVQQIHINTDHSKIYSCFSISSSQMPNKDSFFLLFTFFARIYSVKKEIINLRDEQDVLISYNLCTANTVTDAWWRAGSSGRMRNLSSETQMNLGILHHKYDTIQKSMETVTVCQTISTRTEWECVCVRQREREREAVH